LHEDIGKFTEQMFIIRLIWRSDDLTVEVIFFGDEKGNGNVTLNEEASAAGRDAKPKL
jgi:hypothetical protein